MISKEEAEARKILDGTVRSIIYSKGFITRDPKNGYDPKRYRSSISRVIRKKILPIGISKYRSLQIVHELYNTYFTDEKYLEHRQARLRDYAKSAVEFNEFFDLYEDPGKALNDYLACNQLQAYPEKGSMTTKNTTKLRR